jgi:hypothetical protein
MTRANEAPCKTRESIEEEGGQIFSVVADSELINKLK